MKYKFNQQERGYITSFSRPRTKMYLILLKKSGSFTWCFELYARYHEHYIEFSFYRFFPNEYIIKFQLSWTKLEQKQRSMSSFEIQGKDVLLFSLKLIGVIVGVLDQTIVQVRNKAILCYEPLDWSIKKSFLGRSKKKIYILIYF